MFGQVETGQDRLGHIGTDWDWSGYDNSGEVIDRSGQDRTGKERYGLDTSVTKEQISK